MPGTYDAKTDTVFYGTGNPGKDFDASDRKGDNLYTDSVVALDAKTGKLKWHRQEIPHDVWDYDSPYEVMLFTKDGKDLIVHMNKSGYVFVLDKNNGNIENIWPISDLKNFVKDIDPKTGELIGRVELTMNKETLICPSTFGARSWNSGAYNPKTGLWYNNVLDFCGYLKPVAQKVDPKDYGTGHTGSNDFGRLVMAPDGRKPGQLSANDPLTGERNGAMRWTCRAFPACSPPAAAWCSTAIPWASFRPLTPRPARCCGASIPAPECAAASSATRSMASSTSWCQADGAPMQRS